MDIRSSFAASLYSKAKPATAPAAQMVQDFTATINRGETTARSAITGGADPHALVEALASSQLAVETVATVRDRVVEAYQEILRMPI
jgi:flagellar hook-basal body complex protein FliE